MPDLNEIERLYVESRGHCLGPGVSELVTKHVPAMLARLRELGAGSETACKCGAGLTYDEASRRDGLCRACWWERRAMEVTGDRNAVENELHALRTGLDAFRAILNPPSNEGAGNAK